MDPDDDFEDHDVPRTADEIARRALVLHCVIAASQGVSRDDITEWLKDEGLWEAASPLEQRFLLNSNPTEKETSNAMWRVEAQVALLWAIRKISSLGSLSEQCDTGPMVDAIPELFSSTKEFIGSAVLRKPDEISEEYEKVYDSHCEARYAVRRNIPIPDSIKLGIVQERHYAFNWLTGYCGQDWDEITTDT
jgi:hypothetical protein